MKTKQKQTEIQTNNSQMEREISWLFFHFAEWTLSWRLAFVTSFGFLWIFEQTKNNSIKAANL